MASRRKKRFLRSLGLPGVRGSQPLESPVQEEKAPEPVVVPAPKPKPVVKPAPKVIVKPAPTPVAKRAVKPVVKRPLPRATKTKKD